MPLYEYLCSDCGKVVEIIQKFSDEPLSTCSGCGGAMSRLLSAPAIQFKGSGWYVTDYSKKSNGGKPEAGSTQSTKSTSEESKPSSKTSEKAQ